ncbi:Fic family protein [Bradyrhizobium sp. BEA-2-5]|uniref:Fic family protein n=1 Tax=Bradyrhizobium sp. BEA-2-5 TaxID=3080015 RepID=UPI00293E2F8F|nr:Fic family protein [Bradyrhizobium sp. BEA-2-5]WOH80243.1 Fic family protein [Bradyrhizobium sp. BEA-2-5]
MDRILRCFDEGGMDLDLRELNLSQPPPGLNRIRHLRRLDISENAALTQLPNEIFQCRHLTELIADDCSIVELPRSIGALKNLTTLSLSFNSLRGLPDEIGDCEALERLILAGCKLRQLPSTMGNCQNLSALNLASNSELSNLPDMNLGDLAIYVTGTQLAIMSRVFRSPTLEYRERLPLSKTCEEIKRRWSRVGSELSADAGFRIDKLRYSASPTLADNHEMASSWQHAAAIVQEWAKKNSPFTRDGIFALNRIILGHENEATHTGVLREVDVQAADGDTWTAKRYPPPQTLSKEMAAFADWTADSERRLTSSDPMAVVEFAAQVHQRLASLHPFEDGNGRTARLAMDWVLLRHGLPPSPPIGPASRTPAVFLAFRQTQIEDVVRETIQGMEAALREAAPESDTQLMFSAE